MLATSCAGMRKGNPADGLLDCVLIQDWRHAVDVSKQYIELVETKDEDGSLHYAELLDRYDYLDSNCIAIDAVRATRRHER